MPKFTREVEIDAVQFTGNNWKTVQDFVGVRNLDPSGKYSFPLFDEADTWMPDRPSPEQYPAVVQVRGMWQVIAAGDWIVREPNTEMIARMTNEEFVAAYGEPIKTTRKSTARKKN